MVLGWVGTLLVGSQVMKLIMEGIHLIYGDHERYSFLGRQLRAMLLFCVPIVGWLMAVLLSVVGNPLRQWMVLGLSQHRLVSGFWDIMLPAMGLVLAILVLAVIYGALAAVIGLMAWMELSAMIVFLGAAWNAESAGEFRSTTNPGTRTR